MILQIGSVLAHYTMDISETGAHREGRISSQQGSSASSETNVQMLHTTWDIRNKVAQERNGFSSSARTFTSKVSSILPDTMR